MQQNIKYNPLFKMLFIIVIGLMLLIPKFMISSLIDERESRHEFSIESVTTQWSKEQTLIGPIISVPYYRYIKTQENNEVKTIKDYIHFLPNTLKTTATIVPESRYRGIYEVVVYNAELAVSGSFNIDYNMFKDIASEDILSDQAFISLGLGDLRGIENTLTLMWNDKEIAFEPGLKNNMIKRTKQKQLEWEHNKESTTIENGVSTYVGRLLNNTRYEFFFELKLKGSNKLKFVPVGKITEVKMDSTWQTPSFVGSFLPDSREISKDGFFASWKVFHLNRNFPQAWTSSNEKHTESIYQSAFGTKLLLPVDNYQKSTRAVKYTMLFITLTFLTLFFIEFLNSSFSPIHPIQYILVGLALLLFYTLLLAISEHFGFNIAFILASIATISLITIHMHTLLKISHVSILIASILSILYSFVFVIIQLEDFALLTGAIGLLVILVIVMYFARKIDWYTIAMKYDKTKED